MSTVTPTPEIEQGQDHIPVALWRRYKQQRLVFNQKPRVATGLVLENSGFTSQRARERLADLLVEREQQHGLASTPEEEEQELELEAAEAEGVEDASGEPEEGSTAAIRLDAANRLAELEEQRRRMSVEALTDPKVRQELLDVESEIAQARLMLDLAGTAEGEIERRAREATEATARAVREQGDAEACELQPAIRKAAARVDTAANTFAEQVAAFRDLREKQAAAIARSGRGQEQVRRRGFRESEVAAALFVACRERGLNLEKFEGSNRDTPLAVGEPEKL